jgi:hypothetical protein
MLLFRRGNRKKSTVLTWSVARRCQIRGVLPGYIILAIDSVVKQHVQHPQVCRYGTPCRVMNICSVSYRCNFCILWVKKYKKGTLCNAEHNVTATFETSFSIFQSTQRNLQKCLCLQRYVLHKEENLLASRATNKFSRMNLLHRVNWLMYQTDKLVKYMRQIKRTCRLAYFFPPVGKKLKQITRSNSDCNERARVRKLLRCISVTG